MKRVLISTLALLLLVSPLAVEARVKRNSNSSARATQKKVATEGAVVKSNLATAKRGYKFEKTSPNTVAVRRANGGGRRGLGYAIQCTCAAGKSGACLAEVGPNEAKCSGSCGCTFQVTTSQTQVTAQ